MKTLWHAWSERRRWRREMKNVPLHQLRANVQSVAFYKNPAKQRWASRWLWRREKLWGNPIALAGLVVTIASAIAGLVGKWLGVF